MNVQTKFNMPVMPSTMHSNDSEDDRINPVGPPNNLTCRRPRYIPLSSSVFLVPPPRRGGEVPLWLLSVVVNQMASFSRPLSVSLPLYFSSA